MVRKYIYVFLFCLVAWNLAFAQTSIDVDQAAVDSLASDTETLLLPDSLASNGIPDSLLTDTLANKTARKPLFDAQIKYNAVDSMVLSIEEGNQVAYLYGEAKVEYGTIELTSGFIRIDFETKEIFASGITDSLGELKEKPHFKEASEEFDCTTLRYNFISGKGFVENVISNQQDGIVHGEKAKMVSKDIFCMIDGKYSTCDAEHPHFYLNITKGKMVGKNALIAGPSYMVLEDFPIYPIMLPFAYIPTNNTKYSSGIIIPSYGEETNYGYYLRDGGFYWAASDYFDLTMKGDIYSKGSWGAKFSTNYRWKYHFSGGFGLNISRNVTGERGIDQSTAKNFSITWNHTQDSKASLSSTFSANVNFSTSGYDRANEYYNQNSYLTNSKSSSISYSKKFLNTPFNMSLNARHSQNSLDSTISLSLPEMTLNMNRIYPFKRKNAVGSKRFYEEISVSYTANMKNSIKTKESELLTTPFSEWQKGVKHSLPISLPSFKLLNYINISPGFSYSEMWYFDKIEKHWVDGHQSFNNITGQTEWVKGYVQETKKQAFLRNYEYSYNINGTTTMYGMYQMKNPNSKLVAIRHKITPSVGFSYHPDFGEERFGFYDWVQTDSLGTMTHYSYAEDGIYGHTGEGKSGSVTFSLRNNIEMKLANSGKQDSTSKERFKKVAIFDDLGFSGSYNLAADSMNLSTISWNARTKIAGINLNLTGSLDPYYYDPVAKRRINQFMWQHGSGLGKIARLTNMSTGFGFNFSSDKIKKKREDARKAASDANGGDDATSSEEPEQKDPLYAQYKPFDMPWSASFNYSFSYVNNGVKRQIIQSLSFNGSVTISPKWSATVNSGFDFTAKKLTNTSLSVSRNLHCWSMAFSCSPISTRPYYSFTLNANASMLKDLKVNKVSRNY